MAALWFWPFDSPDESCTPRATAKGAARTDAATAVPAARNFLREIPFFPESAGLFVVSEENVFLFILASID
jgi:hypothetical protein